ncbi:hypothetical protein H310_05343 [Aphanomyces invadans]|uniref:Selenoprotein T n=1 Tax=Aphanomyces invadans TaxID=157072 RepID=A0A024U8Z1_9STRA|nr:hypothetical protein H310_05343 [Aphanomyces invadans]ETW02871.1 hypothetical protein H310_05343 [Aphanomyces invadans]|eukprot:XP_008868255.1 hypothetical protein H310_05343 [Aphanomyces invadans]
MSRLVRWLLMLALLVLVTTSTAKQLQEKKQKKVTSFVDDKHLETNYPHLIGRVEGAYHLAPVWKQNVAACIGYIQMAGFALLLFGEHILSALSLPADFYLFTQMRENKFVAFGVLMVLGSVSQSMLTTGAFEVFYNDELIFSKIQANRWPSMQELVQLLSAKGLSRH